LVQGIQLAEVDVGSVHHIKGARSSMSRTLTSCSLPSDMRIKATLSLDPFRDSSTFKTTTRYRR
jgi:hypothetical protein